MNTRELFAKGTDILREGLVPYVESGYKERYGDNWVEEGLNGRVHRLPDGGIDWDPRLLLKKLKDWWGASSDSPRLCYAYELAFWSNRAAHQSQPFSEEDTARILDTMRRLLLAIDDSEGAAKLQRLCEQLSLGSTGEGSASAVATRVGALVERLSPPMQRVAEKVIQALHEEEAGLVAGGK